MANLVKCAIIHSRAFCMLLFTGYNLWSAERICKCQRSECSDQTINNEFIRRRNVANH